MYDDISEADQIHTMMVVVLEVIRNSPSFVEIELEEAILLQDEITFTCRHLHQDVLNDVQLTNTLAAYRRDLHKAISSWLGTLPPDLFTAMLHVRNGIHWRIRNDRLGVDTLERTLAWLRQTQSSTASDAWSSGASEDSSDESGHGMSEGSSNSADRSDVTRNQEDECNWMFHDGPSPGKPSQRRCAGPFVADEQDGFLIVEKPSDKSGSRGAMDRLLDMCEIEEIEESSVRSRVDEHGKSANIACRCASKWTPLRSPTLMSMPSLTPYPRYPSTRYTLTVLQMTRWIFPQTQNHLPRICPVLLSCHPSRIASQSRKST